MASVATRGKKWRDNSDNPQPMRPLEKALREKIDAETRAIEELKIRTAALQKNISGLTVGKDEYLRKKAEMQDKLEELQRKGDAYESERLKLIGAIESKHKESREMRANVNSLKKTLGFSTEDDIDKKIQEIENLMMTSTMTLKDEKKLVLQISQLKANKPLVGKYTTMENSANSFEHESVVPLRARLDKLSEELREVRRARKEQYDKCTALINERSVATGPVKEFIEEREMLNNKIKEHIARRAEAVAELNTEIQKYKERQMEVNATRQARVAEERKKRAVEQERITLEKKLDMEGDLPLAAEVLLLQQTAQYVQKLMNDHTNNKQQSNGVSKEVEKPSQLLLQGDGVALLPKKDREEEYFFAPKGKKSGGKKPSKQKEKSKTLKHDIATLSVFDQCGVDTPVTADDLEGCLAKLNEKLAFSKGEQEKKIEERKGRRKELEAQLAALNGKIVQEKAIAVEEPTKGAIEAESEEN